MRRCSLFASLPDEALAALASHCRRRRYTGGEALFLRGDHSEATFVLCSGQVRAVVSSNDGREVVLHVSEPGEAPGYLDLVDGRPRSVDAIAVDEVEVLVLPARVVRATLLDHPEALMLLAEDLVGIVRILDRKVGDLVFLDLSARLAKALLAIADGATVAPLGMTQSELASQLGVARQSLNRSLGRFQEQGLIRVGGAGSTVEILDTTGLERIASSTDPLSPG